MIDEPTIARTSEQLTAMVRITIPRAEIQKAMGPGINEVKAAIAAQGIATAGPWLTHHLRMDPKVFDFEICVPVKSPVSATGRVKPGRLPAARVARTVYHGPYEGLGAAWGEFGDWIKAKGLNPAEDLWEVYTVDPESNPDPSSWRTELNRPLRGEG
jgi:effector-binding domain-containing protein